MATPDFITELRASVGHAHLWLSGVTVFVFETSGRRALFVRRADNGQWTPVTGIIDPNEQPADAAAREVLEETGCSVRVTQLVKVGVAGPTTYQNGDQASYLDLTFIAQWTGGEPYPADGENSEARWFPINAAPPMNERFTELFARAVAHRVHGPLPAEFKGGHTLM